MSNTVTRFQTFSAGGHIQTNKIPAPLLPTGYAKKEQEPEKKIQTNKKVKPLFPTGMNPKN